MARRTALEMARRIGVPDSESGNIDWMLESGCGNYTKSFTFPWRPMSDFGDNLPDIKSGIIVDAGCSYGSTSRWLSSYYSGCNVVGVDLEADRLPEDSIDGKLTFKHGNFFLLHKMFKPSSLSAIFHMNGLTYYSRMDMVTMLLYAEKMYSLLTPGGHLCISGGGEDCEGFATAVLQKDGEWFKEIYANDQIRIRNDFPILPECFGIKGRVVGT